mmetsp:Transcript_88301/g.227695  ORF Transcript_88301/g.227695 Transcript_88301/m.227695 type:complete len:111 (+) Transcript_88301:165-497(+)
MASPSHSRLVCLNGAVTIKSRVNEQFRLAVGNALQQFHPFVGGEERGLVHTTSGCEGARLLSADDTPPCSSGAGEAVDFESSLAPSSALAALALGDCGARGSEGSEGWSI